MDFNVYEQRADKLKPHMPSEVIHLGSVTARNSTDALKTAKLKAKWPMLHQLNSRGDEI